MTNVICQKEQIKKNALVVVMGDLARSPRMQYHCISLARAKYNVTVIGYGGGPSSDKSCKELEKNPNIRQQLIPDTLNLKNHLPSLLAYIVKPILLTLLFVIQLMKVPIPHIIIAQNPPSIPTLPITYLYSRLVRAKLIIDWHNYGFSILSLKLASGHIFVSLYKFIEFFFGRLADAGFCVSEKMQCDLKDNFRIPYPIIVLYDKAPSYFRPMSVKEKHKFFDMMTEQIPVFKSSTKDSYVRSKIPREHCETRFSTTSHSAPYSVMMKSDRPFIILTSTSWTEDEDFDLLLNALQLYDQSVEIQRDCDSEHNLPQLVCVITGKGPLKAYYKEKITKMNLKNIDIVLPWLTAEDYPRMVGCCDIGLSLHSSSSGVDLPMKVVDMFGCGIPVLAYRYKAINELVVEDFYGLTFKDSQELFQQLNLLLRDIKKMCLSRYRSNIIEHFTNSRWEANWSKVAKPLFDKLS